jgi:hypothetical protein
MAVFYTVFCDECDAEYSVRGGGDNLRYSPSTCTFCGSKLEDSNIVNQEDLGEWADEDWDSLKEEFLDSDEEEWK